MAFPNLVGGTSRGSNFNAACGYRAFLSLFHESEWSVLWKQIVPRRPCVSWIKALYGIRKLRRSTVYDISDNANEKTSVLFSGFWDGGSRIERQSTEKEVSRPHDHSYRRIMNYRRRICPPRCTTRDVFKRVKCFSL